MPADRGNGTSSSGGSRGTISAPGTRPACTSERITPSPRIVDQPRNGKDWVGGRRLTRLVLYVRGFPPRETGGPPEVAFHLVRELVRGRGFHLTLVVQTDSTEAEIRDRVGACDGLVVLRLPYYPTPREVLDLRGVLRAFASADIIHFNEFPFRHFPLIVLAKVRGVPVVFSMHGLVSREVRTFLGPEYPVTVQEGNASLRVRLPRGAIRALLSLYRSFARAWSAVIVPSEALLRDATSMEQFPSARISVIPHGVDLPESVSRIPGSHAGPLRILFVGKLEPVKGPDLLLDAVGRLLREGIHVDLSIVGAGSMEGRLRAQTKALGLDRAAFLGPRRGKDLESLYAASDLVVVPSRHETLSLVVLEAMAAGRPILATNVGGIPETARQPRNALLVPPDSEALADSLRRLIQQPALREAMALANLADAGRRSWPNVIDRYVEVYGTLLSPSRAAATHDV